MLGREARKLRCEVVPDESLEEEVAFMVEYPSVSSGRFAEKFLQLPDEIMITTLRHHQKCFSLRKGGRITNGFLAVVNSRQEKARNIVGGMERIAEGRLSDAEFYWNEDRKLSMEKRIELLRRIQFHEKLGTYHEKVKRIARLSSSVCSFTGISDDIQEAAKKAALLSKADLTTEMVKDFPELQGIMGGIYASREGMGEDVSRGIYEHYRPMSMEDESPSSTVGAILSVSDKIDTIIGCFGIGLIPSGSKDPFGLRRASHGVLKVCVDRGFSIPLDEMLGKGMECYKESSIKLEEDGLTEKIMSYLKERMKFFFESEGHSYDTVNAVLASECGDPLDASMRVKALTEIRTLKDFEALAFSHKRIRNIISAQPRGEVSIGLFIEPDEKELYARYSAVTERVKALKNEKRYLEALREIATLRSTVDRFFDAVLVMTDEEDVRRNRISLLCSLSDLFMQVADFSEIVVSGQ
jgi:glycyl-tRNA synthetase beta chain